MAALVAAASRLRKTRFLVETGNGIALSRRRLKHLEIS
jgi:hypothetical protein